MVDSHLCVDTLHLCIIMPRCSVKTKEFSHNPEWLDETVDAHDLFSYFYHHLIGSGIFTQTSLHIKNGIAEYSPVNLFLQ